MTRNIRLMIAAGLAFGFTCLPVLAQTAEPGSKTAPADKAPAADKPADDAAAQPAAPVGDVNTELAALKQEVQAMRSDMRLLLRELQSIKAAQAQAAKPAAAPRPAPAMEMLGKPAPEGTLASSGPSSKELKVGGKSDKVKVAFFFASWCGFCKRAMPSIEQLNKDYAGKDVEIVAISLDTKEGQRAKTEPEIMAVIEQSGMQTVPMAWDPEKKLGNQFKVQSFPTSFVIGKDGLVQAVHVGGPTDLAQQIKGEVDKLLAGESLLKPAAAAPAAAPAGAKS